MLSLYGNGAFLASTGSTAVAVGVAVDSLKMGRAGGTAAGWYGGSIDDVRIYSRVLSLNEIQALYLAGAY